MLSELEALYQECPDGLLYHYTSNSAILGIVEKGAIWATEIRYLNDSSELVTALSKIAWAALGRAQTLTGEAAALLRDFSRWCDSANLSDRLVFVVSLTAQGNRLSQWRAYAGGDGQGAALAFDARLLKAIGESRGFYLGRCIYDESVQHAYAERVIDHLLVAFERFDWDANVPAGHESVRFYPLFDSLFYEVMSLAALMKHPAFHEEDEWRLVSTVTPSLMRKDLLFRPGRSCIIPYVELSIAEKDKTLKVLKGANIGPCQNPNLAMASLAMLLDRHVSGDRVLQNFRIPLRTPV